MLEALTFFDEDDYDEDEDKEDAAEHAAPAAAPTPTTGLPTRKRIAAKRANERAQRARDKKLDEYDD